MESLVMSVSEMARVLSLGRTRAYELVHEGRIGSIRLGGKILIPRAEIERLIESGIGNEDQERGNV